MSWFPNINFSAAGQVNPNQSLGKTNASNSANKAPNLLGAGSVDRFEASNPLGVQPASNTSSAASIVNAVSNLDVDAARSQLSPTVQEGLAVFGNAAPKQRSTPENTDVSSLVANVANLSLEDAQGQISPGTLYGLQAFGALG